MKLRPALRTPAPAAPATGARVVALAPARARAARRRPAELAERCAKCDSTFVEREPAFLHCRYCGAMARIARGSLRAQEEFEIRSGLRLAS